MNLGHSTQIVLMLTPHGYGSFCEQVSEVLSSMDTLLQKQPQAMTVTVQTIFLRNPHDRSDCDQMLAAHYGSKLPATNYVFQPPCCDAALAMEVWAIGGNSLRVEHFHPHALAISFDGITLVHCAGITIGSVDGAYAQSLTAMERMRDVLDQAGSRFEHIIRTWLFLGGITETEADTQRYKELNRARTAFYRDICFFSPALQHDFPYRAYPSSTGIGMDGTDLIIGCLALETQRKDVFLVPLENPAQTPAYDYPSVYSPESPKFSRAIALVVGDYITTWISGTASIVDLDSLHVNDVEKQTEQTIDNIEMLISPENFSAHGVSGAGACLHDLAQVRIYLKRPQDFAKCKAICERRFGSVPAIYTIADVCRPELLVEIEGVAFSHYSPKDIRPLKEI